MMNCCEKCFKDIEIKALIKKQKKGNCDFCGSKNTYVSDVSECLELKENFERLIDVYSSESSRPEAFPKEKMDLLKNILAYKWNIFNLQPDAIYRFLTTLLPERYMEQPEIFDNPVGIFEEINDDYLGEYSILGKYQWEDFVTEIKEKNRFHTNSSRSNIIFF